MSQAIALYARVSSARQAQQSTIESQLSALRERVATDGHTLVASDEYVDNGYSGSILLRPGLERLHDRIAEGAVDVLYVLSPDRLARRHAHQVLLLEEFSARGIQVVVLQGRGGDNAEDQLLTQVQGVIAEYERAKIMERSRRGKLHKAKSGVVSVLSNAPYGYLYVKKSEHTAASYQIVLHQARVVRRIFEAVAREQMSLFSVATMLTKEAIPTARGQSSSRPVIWRAATLRQILSNPAYMGKAAFGKTTSIERPVPLRLIKGRAPVPKHAKSTARFRPQEEWITIDVPAIVSAEVFEAARAQLERNKVFAQRNRSPESHLLAGLTVCARCRYGYYGRFQGVKNRYRYYVCGSVYARMYGVADRCGNHGVRGELLETHVWESVCALLQDPSRVMVEWQRRAITKRSSSAEDTQLHEARRTVLSLEGAIQRLMDGYEAGAIELSDLTTRVQRTRARLAQANAELRALEKVLSDQREFHLVIGRVQEFARRVGAGLDALSWSERREIVRALISRIEIDDDDVTLVYRIPAALSQPGFESPAQLVDCDHGANTPK